MNEEQLILLVQEYPLLYDLQDPNYCNQLARENAWEEIGYTMKCKPADCKNKWKGLRDSFRKNIKNRETKSGQAASNKKAWRFEKQMEFLRKHVQEQRPGRTNITAPSLARDEDAEYDEENIDSPAASTVDEELLVAQSPASTNASSGPPPSKKGKKSANSTFGTADVLREYLQFKKEKGSTKSVDHLTKYFAGIEETVRTLPTYLQIKVKSQISTIVHQAEYEADSARQQHRPPQEQPPQYSYFQNVSPSYITEQSNNFSQNTQSTPNVGELKASNIEQQSSFTIMHL